MYNQIVNTDPNNNNKKVNIKISNHVNDNNLDHQ
jgi:hypothetical protein